MPPRGGFFTLMDTQNMSFGSASPAMGGTDPLQAAIAARQTGQAGATQQVTPSAPTFDPSMAGQAPAGSPQAPQGASSAMGGAPLPFDPGEVKIILSAMGGRMKAISKLQGA